MLHVFRLNSLVHKLLKVKITFFKRNTHIYFYHLNVKMPKFTSFIRRKETECIETLTQAEKMQLIQEAAAHKEQVAHVDLLYVFWLMDTLGWKQELSPALFGSSTTEAYLETMNMNNKEQWKVLLSYSVYCGIKEGFGSILITRLACNPHNLDGRIIDLMKIVCRKNPAEARTIFEFVPRFLETKTIAAARLAVIDILLLRDREPVKQGLMKMISEMQHVSIACMSLRFLLDNAHDKTITFKYLVWLSNMVVTENTQVAMVCASLLTQLLDTHGAPLSMMEVEHGAVYFAVSYAVQRGYVDKKYFNFPTLERLDDVCVQEPRRMFGGYVRNAPSPLPFIHTYTHCESTC